MTASRAKLSEPGAVTTTVWPRLPVDGPESVTEGDVLSRFTITLADAEFPARSNASPDIVWFAPSVVTFTGSGQLRIPLSWSSQVNETVTSESFHPFAFDGGDAVAVMVGGVASFWTVTATVPLSDPPRPSETTYVKLWTSSNPGFGV
jgi:hypothetical protein